MEKEIKKLAKEGKLTIGTERVIKGIKSNTLKQVAIAANCPEDVRETIKHYAAIAQTTVTELAQDGEELGTICKKPFPITVLGYS